MATSQKPTTQTSSGAADNKDVDRDEVQARFDEAAEKGYFGHTPDETPNENYTLKGVTSGAPTPENQRGQK